MLTLFWISVGLFVLWCVVMIHDQYRCKTPPVNSEARDALFELIAASLAEQPQDWQVMLGNSAPPLLHNKKLGIWLSNVTASYSMRVRIDSDPYFTQDAIDPPFGWGLRIYKLARGLIREAELRKEVERVSLVATRMKIEQRRNHPCP